MFRSSASVLLAIVISVCLIAVATASDETIYIRHDKGGDLAIYKIKAIVARELNLKIVIDGICASACTVLIGLPRDQVCATERAELQFHSARLARPRSDGQALVQRANINLMKSYPPGIRNWINRQGGLTNQLLKMKPREVLRFIRPCAEAPLVS